MKTTYPHFPHKCLGVLGNELRCAIIESLRKKPKTVSEIVKELKKEQSVVSHALTDLKKCNFVGYKKRGKEREYFLASDIFTHSKHKPLFELIEEHVRKHCTPKK
jgi:DNA-binding transcriptional regulator GbsR (MarR family)